MTADPYLTDDDGVPVYVVATSSWGRTTSRFVSAPSLTEAKATHGWTRERHTSVKVRRGRHSDVPFLAGPR